MITVNLETEQFILKLCKIRNHNDLRCLHLENYEMYFFLSFVLHCPELWTVKSCLHSSEGSLQTFFSLVPRGTNITKQIVIGTPGTVLDWCFKKNLIDLTKIRVFVLDEADVMIATQGFLDQSIRIQR